MLFLNVYVLRPETVLHTYVTHIHFSCCLLEKWKRIFATVSISYEKYVNHITLLTTPLICGNKLPVYMLAW